LLRYRPTAGDDDDSKTTLGLPSARLLVRPRVDTLMLVRPSESLLSRATAARFTMARTEDRKTNGGASQLMGSM